MDVVAAAVVGLAEFVLGRTELVYTHHEDIHEDCKKTYEKGKMSRVRIEGRVRPKTAKRVRECL